MTNISLYNTTPKYRAKRTPLKPGVNPGVVEGYSFYAKNGNSYIIT